MQSLLTNIKLVTLNFWNFMSNLLNLELFKASLLFF